MDELISILKLEDSISGIILMGSYGDGKQQKGSDVDLLILFNRSCQEPGKELEKLIEKNYKTENILLLLPRDNKLVFYKTNPFLIFDLAHSYDLDSKARYLRGSEKCRVLFDKTDEQDLAQKLSILMQTRAFEVLPEYKPQSQAGTFLESFELLCKTINRGDRYRIEFYSFLVRHALVTLETMGRGERTHLYLVKNAFRGGSKVEKLPILAVSEAIWPDVALYADLFVELCGKCEIGAEKVKKYENFLKTVVEYYKK